LAKVGRLSTHSTTRIGSNRWRTGGDLGVLRHRRAARGRGYAIQPVHVLGSRQLPDTPFDHIPVGGYDHVRGKPLDVELASGFREILHVDLDRYEVGLKGCGDIVAGKDSVTHSLAREALFAPEVYQNQPVRLGGHAFCRFQVWLPPYPLLG
jgi:hypothetical protein